MNIRDKLARRSRIALVAMVVLLVLLVPIAFVYLDGMVDRSYPDYPDTSWARSGHNLKSDKYSPLSQINKDNVDELKLAWTYRSGVSGSVLSVQTNPIYSKGLLFTTSDCCLIGVDARSGAEVWKRALPPPVARRGLTYYEGNLYVPTQNGVHVVIAETGEINKSLGERGVFGKELTYLPPIVLGNQLIIANFLGSVESWDIGTGKQLWKTSLSTKDGTHPRLWSGLSADPENGMVFVVTSNRAAFFTKGYGDSGDYAISLLALRAVDGKILWHFQEIEREIWDLDMVGPPIVAEISKDGKRIPVAISVSKTGNTILVERKTGKSIFGFSYQKVPPSDIEGETPSERQIVISKPEPFSELYFDLEKDVTHLSQSKRDYVLHKVRNSKSGRHMPVSLNHDVVMYGLNGGAEWPGAAIDPESSTLIVPSNNYPFILRVEYVDKNALKSEEIASKDEAYIAKCGLCHGKDLAGSIDWGMGDRFNPALIGITRKRDRDYLTSIDMFKRDHKYAEINNTKEGGDALKTITDDDLLHMYELFQTIDKDISDRGDFSPRGTYQYLLDPDGQFGSNPPWGHLTAIDLNTGLTKWKGPFGEVYDEQTKQTYQGDVNVGGVIVTGGGIVFGNGTRDQKARAFDVENGRLLWEVKLPATGSAPPMTFVLDGCQYVVFTATGGGRFKNYSDSTVAYKLASCKSE